MNATHKTGTNETVYIPKAFFNLFDEVNHPIKTWEENIEGLNYKMEQYIPFDTQEAIQYAFNYRMLVSTQNPIVTECLESPTNLIKFYLFLAEKWSDDTDNFGDSINRSEIELMLSQQFFQTSLLLLEEYRNTLPEFDELHLLSSITGVLNKLLLTLPINSNTDEVAARLFDVNNVTALL